MAARTISLDKLPGYLQDKDDNQFIVSLLEDKCFSEDGDKVAARMANVRLALFVKQTKAFFPEQYEEGGDGGNVQALPGSAPGWAS